MNHVGERAGRRSVPALVVLVLLAACSTGSSAPRVLVHGVVSFDVRQALANDFPARRASVVQACGTDRAQYAAELLSTPPQKARVQNEWGPIILGTQGAAKGVATRSLSGQPMPAEGVVSDGHIDAEGGFFAGDLPFTHPFGKDYTTDIVLDRPFAGLAQNLGSAPNDVPDGSIHSELPLGLFPQDGHGSILPGFLPPDGDRIATSGTWVVDCGHPDYHTEIHDMNFLAFGHSEGDRTVAHAFAVPYDVTNLFTTHASLVTRFSSPTRLGPPVSQPIGPFLFNLVQGIATGKVHSDHLFEHNVVVPTEPMWPSWYVCAPPSARGSLGFSYRFTVRPGIAVTAKPNDDLGCVRFEAVATGSFRPAPITVRSCPLSWSSLERVAAEAGLGQFDVQGAIASQVPATFRDALRPVIRHSPVFDCFRPFSVAPPGGSSARSLLTDDAQPFPFYGEVTVTRK